VQVFENKKFKDPELGFRNPKRDSYEVGVEVRACD